MAKTGYADQVGTSGNTFAKYTLGRRVFSQNESSSKTRITYETQLAPY